MSTRSALVDRLLDVVTAADLDEPDQDFLGVALALLALAVSKLPLVEREAVLQAIEFGALRQAVAQFPAASSPFPQATNNNGHALQ